MPEASTEFPGEVPVNADLNARVRKLLHEGMKIKAIKLLRDEASVGLLEAKHLVDGLMVQEGLSPRVDLQGVIDNAQESLGILRRMWPSVPGAAVGSFNTAFSSLDRFINRLRELRERGRS